MEEEEKAGRGYEKPHTLGREAPLEITSLSLRLYGKDCNSPPTW